MKKLIVYPFDEDYQYLLNHPNEINFKECKCVVPDDFLKFYDSFNVYSDKDIEAMIDSCDSIWISNACPFLSFDRISAVLDYAKMQNKEIIYARDIDDSGDQYVELNTGTKLDRAIKEDKNRKEVYSFDIDTPILYIVGMAEALNEFSQAVTLLDEFKKMGYKVALFSDAKESHLIKDGYNLPISNAHSIESVISINNFIKKIEAEYDYDLFLISLMKGACSFGRKIPEDFGLSAYSLSRAVIPDCVIANVFYGNYNQEELEEMITGIRAIIDNDIDFINIQNKVIDMDKSESQRKIVTRRLDKEKLKEKISELGMTNVFSTKIENDSMRLADKVVCRLNGFAEIKKI